MLFREKKYTLPQPGQELAGRLTPMPVTETHYVSGHRIKPPFPEGLQTALFGLGCFWGAERLFWQQPGVYSTAVGYTAGLTPNPSYDEVCTGMTGHNEVVLVVFDPAVIEYQALVALFFESHNPTQGMRQGNDMGTQYRSGIYTFSEDQQAIAEDCKQRYQVKLRQAGLGPMTTEIHFATEFYYAENYHQQYLAKNPGGYCGLAGTGVCVAD